MQNKDTGYGSHMDRAAHIRVEVRTDYVGESHRVDHGTDLSEESATEMNPPGLTNDCVFGSFSSFKA